MGAAVTWTRWGAAHSDLPLAGPLPACRWHTAPTPADTPARRPAHTAAVPPVPLCVWGWPTRTPTRHCVQLFPVPHPRGLPVVAEVLEPVMVHALAAEVHAQQAKLDGLLRGSQARGAGWRHGGAGPGALLVCGRRSRGGPGCSCERRGVGSQTGAALRHGPWQGGCGSLRAPDEGQAAAGASPTFASRLLLACSSGSKPLPKSSRWYRARKDTCSRARQQGPGRAAGRLLRL